MGWKMKTAVIVSVGMFLAGCAWLGFVVCARYRGNDYLVQVTASFNAASLVNGEETFTEPDKAVISTFEGRRYVVIPENYKAIVSLLRKDHVMPLFRRVGKDAPLSVVICGGARLRIEPDGDSVDGALVSFDADNGRHYTMHVRGGNIWRQIVQYTTEGPLNRRNLPLE